MYRAAVLAGSVAVFVTASSGQDILITVEFAPHFDLRLLLRPTFGKANRRMGGRHDA
jgi:hypothetical protein